MRPIDKSIKNIISKLNELGFITKYSCSGLFSEHKSIDYPFMESGYILFSENLTSDKINQIIVASKKAKLEIEKPGTKIYYNTYVKGIYQNIYVDQRVVIRNTPSPNIVKMEENDIFIKNKWKKFIKEIISQETKK
jgi:hypothetical protein